MISTRRPSQAERDPLVAVLGNYNRVNLISAKTGTLRSHITMEGKIVNGPMCSGDNYTVVLELANGRKTCVQYNLYTSSRVTLY